MALESLCGMPQKRMNSDPIFGPEAELPLLAGGPKEVMDGFPNAADPMEIIAPPFVSGSFSNLQNSG